MKKELISALSALSVLFSIVVQGQDKVLDIITLKNGKGVIEGFICEQKLGEYMKIIPSSAVLKVDFDSVTSIPTIKQVKKDTTNVNLDILTLKSGGTLEGRIEEQSPGKWYLVRTENLPAQNYRNIEIEKIGKRTVRNDINIFKAYGIIDVLKLRNGDLVKGIIIEQTLGFSLKIKTLDDKILVFYIGDVESTTRESFDNTRDIFKQSAFLDLVTLKNGTVIKGIINQQIPNKELKIETIGNSNFVQKIEDVVKISKEKNPYKEDIIQGAIKTSLKEPMYIGDCLKKGSKDSLIVVEKQQFVRDGRNRNLLLIDGSEKSTTRILQNEETTIIVRVRNNNVSPKEQVYLFKIEYNKGNKKRYIDAAKHRFLDQNGDSGQKTAYVPFVDEKYGDSSFRISFKIAEPGEYAIFVEGCEKTFALFGIDEAKSTR